MTAPLVALVAGEPSGDQLGAGLMRALRREAGGHVRFAGVGGEAMAGEGLASLFPIDDLAVMGLVEVVPSIPRVLRRLAEATRAIRAMRPAVLVTIDAQAFSRRLAARLQPAPFPVVHYVGPTVWAWRPGRAAKLAAVVDRVLLLFPFEPPHWRPVGLDAVYVGHPAVDAAFDPAEVARCRARLLAGGEGPLLALLPGSRAGEARRHLPIFRRVAEGLARRRPGLRAVVPTLPALAPSLRRRTGGWRLPVAVDDGPGRRLAMAAADAALAVSGTVSLDLAAAGTPHVVAYRAHPLTAAVVRRLLKVGFASPVNLVAGREAVPEFCQERCRAPLLAAALEELLDDAGKAAAQRSAMAAVAAALRPEGASPSTLAARAVLELIGACQPPAAA